MKTQTRVEIPVTIVLVETRPDVIEYQGKAVERDRHSVRFKLPNGHTVEATLSNIEVQKIREIVPNYKVEDEETTQ